MPEEMLPVNLSTLYEENDFQQNIEMKTWQYQQPRFLQNRSEIPVTASAYHPSQSVSHYSCQQESFVSLLEAQQPQQQAPNISSPDNVSNLTLVDLADVACGLLK